MQYKDLSALISVPCRGVFKNLTWRFKEEVDFVNAWLGVAGKPENFVAPPPPEVHARPEPERPATPKDKDDVMRVAKLTVNVNFMKWFMSTQAALDLKWGCMSYSKVLGCLLRLCRDETADGFGTLLVSIHEPKNPIGLRGRQVTGGGDGHPLLQRESSLAASKGLVGFANFPKIIRACLTVGVSGTFDLDLDNSHMTAFRERHSSAPFPLVSAYIANKTAERARLAASMGVGPGDVKELMVSALYMSKGAWWLDLHQLAEFSPEMQAFMDELKSACKLDAEKYPELLNELLANRKFLTHQDPMASLFAYLNNHFERPHFDQLVAEVDAQYGELKIPLGDGGIFQGSRIKPDVIVQKLQQQNITASLKPLPMTQDEFEQFVRETCAAKKDPVKFPEPKFTVLPGLVDQSKAILDAQRSLSLSAHKGLKSGIDHDAFGRALALENSVVLCYSSVYKDAVEIWVESKKRWEVLRSDDRCGPLITDALKLVFKEFEIQLVVDYKNRGVFEPVELPSNSIFGDNAFRNNVKKALMARLQRRPVLNNPALTRHLLHFECGTTLNLAPGVEYDDQARPGQLSDRNCRSTGWSYKPFSSPEVRKHMAKVVQLLELIWDRGERLRKLDELDPEIEHSEESRKRHMVLQKLITYTITMVEKLASHCPLLKVMAGSHGTRENPGYEEAFYELLQFTRAACGAKGLDELLMYYGPTGSNRKSTTNTLLYATFGCSQDVNSPGYVTIQKSTYFQQTGSANASAPDEGVAALYGAKLVLVDEFKKNEPNFNVDLTKMWSDSGAVIPYEKKFGERMVLTATWLMVWFLNDPPCFRDAGEPFFRRLSSLPMLIQFKGPTEYKEADPTHRIADTTIRAGAADYKFEFIEWIRLMSKGVHKRVSQSTFLLPRPACVTELNYLMANQGAVDEAPPAGALTPLQWKEKYPVTTAKGEVPVEGKVVKDMLCNYFKIGALQFSQKLAEMGCCTKNCKRNGKNLWCVFDNINGFQMLK